MTETVVSSILLCKMGHTAAAAVQRSKHSAAAALLCTRPHEPLHHRDQDNDGFTKQQASSTAAILLLQPWYLLFPHCQRPESRLRLVSTYRVLSTIYTTTTTAVLLDYRRSSFVHIKTCPCCHVQVFATVAREMSIFVCRLRTACMRELLLCALWGELESALPRVLHTHTRWITAVGSFILWWRKATVT